MSKNKKKSKLKKYIKLFGLIVLGWFVHNFVFDFSQITTYINENSVIIQGLFTLALIFITAYYAWQTKRTVNVMNNAEKERNRPRISVYLKQSDEWVNFVYLVISNHGNSIVKNIKFYLKDDFKLTLSNRNLSDVRQFKEGIKNLTPGRELVIPVFNLVNNFEEFKKANIKISIKYFDTFEQQFNDEFVLDITSLVDHQLGEPPIYKIEKNIEKISKSIQKIENKLKKYE